MDGKKIILYIDVMYRGGAQRVMANIANYFVEKNWDVVLINDFVQDTNISQYKVSAKVRRIYLRNKLSGNTIIKNIERIYNLRKIIELEQPNTVLSFLGRPNIRMLISTIGLSCKKIVSIRNDPEREYGSSRLRKRYINMLFGLANGYVFQTEEASRYFNKKIQKKSTVILNPVDDVFFRIGREKQTHHIISVGRLEPQKNQKMLIKAFAEIAEQYPQENLIIYGEGNQRNELEKEISTLKLEGRVFLPGNISNVEEILASARMFVLSSDYEGLPNALMEAMAVGVPCISTDCPCGGPGMLIDQNSEGILVQCDNPQQMANAMKKILEDQQSERLGRKAKERAKEFQIDVIMERWEKYLA